MACPETFPDFRVVTVTRPQPSMLFLQWSLEPTSWPFEDLAFINFRSNGPTGPWDEVATAEVGRYVYYDYDVISPGVNRLYYYIIRVASISGQGYRDCDPVTLQHAPDHIAMEMVRKKTLFLRVKGGIGAVVLLKKSWGPKCSRCYNHERGQPDDCDCTECYGTGYPGGYLTPVFVPALANLTDTILVRAGLKYETDQTYWEMANYPVVSPEDVVVDQLMNIRYRIDRVHPTSHRGYPISQIINILRADDTDVLYRIPVSPPANTSAGRDFDMISRTEPHEVNRLAHTPSR
jgi:hypothetical protein